MKASFKFQRTNVNSTSNFPPVNFGKTFQNSLIFWLIHRTFPGNCSSYLFTIQNSLEISRSNHRRCSVRKGVPRNFEKLTGKHLRQSLFLNKVAGLRLFCCEFCEIFWTLYLHNTSGRLPLNKPFVSSHLVYFFKK